MITVELADPAAFHVGTPLGNWFVSASNAGRLKQELRKTPFLSLGEKEQVSRLGALADDATLLLVPAQGNSAWFYRTINATRDLYYRRDEKGNGIIGDHFRNLLASVPAGERRPTCSALLDFLLFLFPAGKETLLEGVRHLVPGELRRLDLETGKEVSVQAETYPCEPVGMGVEEAVEALEEALRTAFADPAADECVLFSGGVDSTLALLFRPGGTAALTVGIDTPEFAFEEEFARETARLLGATWRYVALKEAEYREHFEKTIVNLGQPIHPNFQPVLMDRAFQEPFGVFWGANASDTLFGHNQTKTILDPVKRKSYEVLIAEPADSPRGYGALSNTSPDFRIVRDLFGEDAVSERIEVRFSHVLAAAKVRPGSRIEEHLQLDSQVEFLTRSNAISNAKRQAAASHGKETREPFFSRAVLRIASAIPPGVRFFHNGESKPVPKALLRKLFPGYPFFGRKGGSDIPRTRFCQEGPFRDFFRENAFPELLPPGGRKLLVDPQWDWSYFAVGAAAFSTWQEKVLKRDRIPQVPGTRVFRLQRFGKPTGAGAEE